MHDIDPLRLAIEGTDVVDTFPEPGQSMLRVPVAEATAELDRVTGTAEAPVYRYASPVSPPTGAGTPTRTGARIVDGTIYLRSRTHLFRITK